MSILGYVDGAVRVTHRSERVEQVVERPGNDDDVVDVEPEGQHNGGYSNTWEWRQSSISVKYEKRHLTRSPVHVLSLPSTTPLYPSALPWDELRSECWATLKRFYSRAAPTFHHGHELPHSEASHWCELSQRCFQEKERYPSKHQGQEIRDQESPWMQ